MRRKTPFKGFPAFLFIVLTPLHGSRLVTSGLISKGEDSMRGEADVVFGPLLLNLKGFIRGSALRFSGLMILVREFHTAHLESSRKLVNGFLRVA